jgi:hypothetical protein
MHLNTIKKMNGGKIVKHRKQTTANFAHIAKQAMRGYSAAKAIRQGRIPSTMRSKALKAIHGQKMSKLFTKKGL